MPFTDLLMLMKFSCYYCFWPVMYYLLMCNLHINAVHILSLYKKPTSFRTGDFCAAFRISRCWKIRAWQLGTFFSLLEAKQFTRRDAGLVWWKIWTDTEHNGSFESHVCIAVWL